MWTSELSSSIQLLRMLVLCLGGLSVGALAYQLWSVPPLAPPLFGPRGKRRALARNHALFMRLEPVMERVAGHVTLWRWRALRTGLQRLLQAAGEPAGLCADELIALCILSSLSLGAVCVYLVQQATFGPWWSGAALLLCASLPLARVRQEAQRRATELERSLPTAMDLCVLCMGAGADFPGALRFVAGEIARGHTICHQELSLVLEELELGRTRVQALTGLGQRTRSRAVRDFTAAVCQSETKGTPLIDALSIQASTLRQRRSVLAEEAAAKAGIRLMFPLMLMVTSLLAIVFGPFIVDGIGM